LEREQQHHDDDLATGFVSSFSNAPSLPSPHKGYTSEASAHRNLDWQAQFQAYCTLQLWDLVSDDHGEELFVDWLCRLFSENGSRATTTLQNHVYLRSGSVKTLHEILNIQTTYGLDYLSFFDLLQRVAEEESPDLMNGHDTAYDDLLPLDTLRHFARDFLAGFVSIMTTLGFEPKMLASPNARAAAIARRQQRQLVVTADATAAAERAAADRADTDDDEDDSSSSSNSSSSSSSSSSGGGGGGSGSSGDPGAARSSPLPPLATSASTASTASTAISPPPPTSAAAAAVSVVGAGAAVAALTASGLPANVPALASSVAVLTPRVAALHRACRSGVVEAVTTALNGVPNVNATDGTGWSALLCAVDSGSVACIKALLKHNADATQRTRAGSGALHLLVKYGASNRQTHSTVAYVKVLTALIEKGAPVTPNADGETPLHIACKAANVVAIEHLLKSTPVDVDHRNAPHQLTALHIAARNGFTEITQLLIKHGADVHATCREGADGPEVTAAQLAAQHQHSECERVLRDRLHDAVQFAAALRGLDAKRTLALLATHPRLLLFTDGEKRNALHFFCGKADLATVRTLLESPLAAQLVDAVDAHGRTPLHVACATFNYAVIVALLDRATNAGRSCADGSTPLHLLANRAPDKQKLAAQVVEKLIGAGVDVNALNGEGETALHLCALSGNEVIAKCLLTAPDAAAKLNRAGESALQYAQRCGSKGIVKLIALAESKQLQPSPYGSARSSRANSLDGSTPAPQQAPPASAE
jgi:ankyrin repeat protein